MNSLAYQLKQIKNLLAGLKIDYAVIGGIAASIYSEPRLTLDVDVNIILEDDKIGLFLKDAKKYGFLPIPPNIRKFAKKTGVLPMRFSKNKLEGRCDFIIARNFLEYMTVKRAHFKKIGFLKVKIATPEDLVIHKITSDRPRDLEDVRSILMKQNKKLDMRYITLWLKKIARINHNPKLFITFKNLLRSC